MAREYYNGRDNYLIYGVETAYATGGTPAVGNKIGRIQSVTLNMNNNLIRSQGIGEGINATNVSLGQFEVSGNINTKPTDFTFLQYGVGYVGGAGTTASPYLLTENGTFGYTSTTLYTTKLELGQKGVSNHQTKTVDGVVISDWTLSGNQGEELVLDINFLGKTVSRDVSLETYTAPSTRTFVFNSGSVIWGSSDVISCSSFNVRCNLNPNYPREVGSRFPKQPSMGVRRYDWTLTINAHFDDSSNVMSGNELMKEFFFDSTSDPITPKSTGVITGSNLLINVDEGTASGEQRLIVQLANSFINDWAENPTLEGGEVQITINGFSLSGVSNQPIKWWVVT